MVGLGIDTGGTCTDAVIYDLDKQNVLSTAKTPTTKNKLEIGIANVVGKLDKEKLSQISFVSLSTTLATNACVENRGTKVKLLFIGVKKEIVSSQYAKYGFESMEDLLFIKGVPEGGYCTQIQPDWDELYKMAEQFQGAQAIGIVQYFPEWNNAAFEHQAKEILSKYYSVPIVCGSDLFSDLNVIQRGAGTYLNIRLIPIINKFLQAVKNVLKQYNLEVPMFVVRSDGSLMNESFTKNHPVETLLCGPASSAIGGSWMSKEKNAVIVDIGGTTTDIALLCDKEIVTAGDGIKINGWKTFVKGLYIDTFGLGGDSAISFKDSKIVIENYRVVPAARAAVLYPQLPDMIKKAQGRQKSEKKFLYEGFLVQRDMDEVLGYSQKQIEFYNRVKQGPILCEEAKTFCGTVNYKSCVERLEREELIIRFGLTPTDVMHVLKDYQEYDTHAAFAALKSFSKYSGILMEKLPHMIYEAFYKKLYSNIVRVLLQQGVENYKDALPKELTDFIDKSYGDKINGIQLKFESDFALIGVGGPAHIFMPQTGKRLNTKVFVHENAKVANAVGTLAGRISVSRTQEFSFCSEDGKEGFRFYIDGKKNIIEDYTQTVDIIIEHLHKVTKEKALLRGAKGKIVYTDSVKKYEAGKGILLGGTILVHAYGEIY